MTARVRLFGLSIASDFPLPGLRPAADEAPVDVTILRGPLGEDANLPISEVGAFRVSDGRKIVIDALPGVPDRNIRLYLLGSAMGLLLHQRGLFPLHANAAVLGGKAIAVAGPSGAGKSTLAAWFSRHGLKLLGDDVIVLRPEGEGIVALPGPPRVRLWRQSLDTFGLGSEGLEQSYTDPDFDKWDLPVPLADVALEELALASVYILEDGAEIAISRLGGAAAAAALFDHTYRGAYVEQVGGAAGHWQTVARIAASVPVYRLERPRDLSRLDALGRSVLDHAAGQAARTSDADRLAAPAAGPPHRTGRDPTGRGSGCR